MAHKLYFPGIPIPHLQEMDGRIQGWFSAWSLAVQDLRKLSLTLSHLLVVGGDTGALLNRVSGHRVSDEPCGVTAGTHRSRVLHIVTAHARCGLFLSSKHTQDAHLLCKYSWAFSEAAWRVLMWTNTDTSSLAHK